MTPCASVSLVLLLNSMRIYQHQQKRTRKIVLTTDRCSERELVELEIEVSKHSCVLGIITVQLQNRHRAQSYRSFTK